MPQSLQSQHSSFTPARVPAAGLRPVAPRLASQAWSAPQSTNVRAGPAHTAGMRTLADRVRVALTMGFGDLATGLEIRANRGVVTLRGEVDELTDITRFETAVREVGDVVDVDNLLRLRIRDQRPHVLSA